MHSDHITDFPDFLFLRWTGGARRPLRVFGPEGTRETVDGFLAALARDIGFRLAHHGEKLHEDGIRVEVEEIAATGLAQRFLDLGGLRIESFEVDHFPVAPAFGYRVTYDGRTVTLSGDTSFCPSLLEASRDVDMLVCEALNVAMLDDRVAKLRAAGATLQASLMEDVPSYHIATAEVAALARDAGVGSLVLSHIIPPVASDGPQVAAFIAGMGDVYTGEIRVARDMERIAVLPRAG
jgi:ribonuclease Z